MGTQYIYSGETQKLPSPGQDSGKWGGLAEGAPVLPLPFCESRKGGKKKTVRVTEQ